MVEEANFEPNRPYTRHDHLSRSILSRSILSRSILLLHPPPRPSRSRNSTQSQHCYNRKICAKFFWWHVAVLFFCTTFDKRTRLKFVAICSFHSSASSPTFDASWIGKSTRCGFQS